MSATKDPSAPKSSTRAGGKDAAARRTLYASLFDDAPFVVSIHEGPDHLYRFANRLGRERLGGKAYLGRPFRAVWPAFALVGMGARYDEAYASGAPVTVPTFRVPPMPSDDPADPPRWARQTLTPWRGADGAVRGVVSFFHDVEAEEEDAEAGRRAAMRLGAALDASAIVGVWDWDTRNGTVHADEGVAALFGLGTDAGEGPLTPEQFGAAMHPDDRERVFAGLDRTVRTGGNHAGEFRVIGPGGRLRTVQTVGHRGQGNEDGGVIRGLTFDVSARREAEAATLDSEARLDAALRAADLGVIDVDKATGAMVWDARARALWGFGPDEPVTSEKVWARIHPGDIEAVRAATAAARRQARTAPDAAARYELRHRVLRGEDDAVWVKSSGTVHAADGKLTRVIGIVADASEEEARKAARSLTVRELSHRIRNVLTVVQAIATQTFRGVAGTGEALRAFGGRLQAFAAAQADLAHDGGQDGDLAGLIERTVGACAPMNQVEAEGPPARPVQHTAQMVALALHELCTNATKYGALSVPEGRVRIGWTREGDSVRLTWTEAGGPPVAKPDKRGFGSTLIEQSLAGQPGGSAAVEYREDGVVCTLTFEAAPGGAA